jgi:hypothetical protein
MKNKAKHTPGPWEYYAEDQRVIIPGDYSKLIADIRGWGWLQKLENGAEVQDANGRLIAAAPTQHEALTKLVGVVEAIIEDRVSLLARPGKDQAEILSNERFFTHELNKHLSKLEDAYAEAVEAIKKATGENQPA